MSPVAGTVVIVNRGEVDRRLLHWVRRLPSNVVLATPTGNQIPHQRNMGAASNIQIEGEFVLYVDSDSVILPSQDVLGEMLAHKVDLVGAVVCERFPPWRVCAVKTMTPEPKRWTLEELPREGLIPVPAMGTGCLLVRRSIFERLGPPWFRCGQIISDLLLEDTEFCLRVHRELGIQPYLDAAIRIGHRASCVIWPGRDKRPWVEWGGPFDVREPIDNVLAVDVDLLMR